jgi:O-antigen/teichoic acid export membrane protein
MCGQFSGFLFPLVVRFHASGNEGALRMTLLDGTRLGVGLVTGVALCLLLFGGDLIQLWMGPGFEAAVVPLYVLAAGGIVMVAQGPTGTILLGTGHHRMVAWASLAEIVLNVALSILLVGRFGLAGVAIGTAVPFALLNLFVLMPAACRAIAVPLRDFAHVILLPAIVGLVPAVLVGVAVQAAAPPATLPSLIARGALVGTVYLLGFWTFGLTSSDRARYLSSVRRIAEPLPSAPRIAVP